MFLGSSSNGVIWPELLPEEAIEVFFSTEENKRNSGRYREKLNFCLSGTLSAVDGVGGPEE